MPDDCHHAPFTYSSVYNDVVNSGEEPIDISRLFVEVDIIKLTWANKQLLT